MSAYEISQVALENFVQNFDRFGLESSPDHGFKIVKYRGWCGTANLCAISRSEPMVEVNWGILVPADDGRNVFLSRLAWRSKLVVLPMTEGSEFEERLCKVLVDVIEQFERNRWMLVADRLLFGDQGELRKIEDNCSGIGE